MTNIRKMTIIAILSAVSFLLMYLKFPLIPIANFLEVDFSLIPILFGLLILDTKSSFVILLMRTLLKLLLNNQGPSTIIGLPMNIAAMSVFILAVAYFWKKDQLLKNYLKAAVVATLGSTLVMLILNYVYAIPVYAAFANFDIKQILGLSNYFLLMVLPFNLLQGILLSVVFYLCYKATRPILKKV
ncbi:ECF transporter S component [Streptococcus ruminantium]|uniref:ECF transporter S component n=1 Tax=Streptococcus ruminantium TaxID=1917441 RepID=UPI00280C68E8|nr:ECF transporter S component [Streptococcus ruminantium]MDQ8767019.1 ECF transporter S component [Streptococcus ruminantium]MDQ8779994.1 ECF transporter S component [Streptococcus ruminantium]MDQ8837554.1 ECF transporter S component [Streptococcus ruminantium]